MGCDCDDKCMTINHKRPLFVQCGFVQVFSFLSLSLSLSSVNRQDSVVMFFMKTQTKTDLVPDMLKTLP